MVRNEPAKLVLPLWLSIHGYNRHKRISVS